MPEPVAAASPKASWPWLWGFLGFLVVALMGSCIQQPLYYPAQDGTAPAQPGSAGPVAVVSFDDVLVPDPSNTADPNTPSVYPQPLSVVSTRQGNVFVAQWSAPSNHLGNADGKALAQAFVQELGQAGLFQSVEFIDDPQKVPDEGFIIRGQVQEAAVEAGDGQEQYRLAVEFSAFRAASGSKPERRFWHGTFSRAALASGGSDIIEIGNLVRGVYQDAIADLTKKLATELAAAQQEEAVLDDAAKAAAEDSDAAPAEQ
jgi:hypothetical protein